MLINCDNKGCLRASNALYDEKSGDVMCQECGQSITNVTESMKRALKSFGQIVRTNQKKAFMMACKSCNANRELALNEDGKVICKICHNEIGVTKSFMQAMEEAGTKLEKIEVKEAPKTKKRGRKKKE